jgi:Flp pilus assembly protein TadG
MISGSASGCSAERGAVAVEAGIIMPALLLLVVGCVEFGRVLWTYNTMLFAVEEAGHYAMVYNNDRPVTCGLQSQAPRCPILSDTPLANCSAARARQVLSAYQTPYIDVSVKEDSTASPATVSICASYSLDLVAPQLLPYGPLNLTRRITVPLL